MKNKNKNAYGVSFHKFEIKDLDVGSRQIVGYGSAFNALDSDRDVIRKGSFLKSIQERGPNAQGNRRIAMLWQHKIDSPIGRFLEMEEDDHGLKFVAELSKSTKGNDALADYQSGVIREHSIGYNYVWDKLEYRDSSESEFVDEDGEQISYWNVTEVKLMEISSVTFGANEFTHVEEVAKSQGVDKALSLLNERISIFDRELRNGSGSDDRFMTLEIGMAQIKSMINSLVLREPSKKDTLKRDKPSVGTENTLRRFLTKK